MRKLPRSTSVLLLLASALLASCQSSTSSTNEVWLVASDIANPPFAWMDASDVAQGRDVEMAQQLASEMGRELRWERMPFDQLLDALESGRVDSIIATMGATPERAERVLLSDSYYITSLSVLVRRGTGEPLNFDDLDGLQVSAGIGTTSEQALNQKLPKALAAKPSEKGASSIDRLLSREVDALVMDAPDALDFEREQPDLLRVLDKPLTEERYIVAVQPGATELLRELNAAIATLRTAGALRALDEKFGLVDAVTER